MTYSTESSGIGRRGAGRMRRLWARCGHALAWPVRVYEARRTMMQLGRLGDHELRDIGLTRLDLADATALAPDADPSLALRRRVEERRRRR